MERSTISDSSGAALTGPTPTFPDTHAQRGLRGLVTKGALCLYWDAPCIRPVIRLSRLFAREQVEQMTLGFAQLLVDGSVVSAPKEIDACFG